MKRRPCWCPKRVLSELNSFLMQTLSFVPRNLHRCWPREWKHYRRRIKICFPSPLRWGTFFNYWGGGGGWVISNSLKSSFSPNMWQQITLWCYCYSLPAFADWPAPIQISYFIGPYSLHYLLFSGIGALFCHYPYCFPSQSKTLFGIGAGRPCVWEVILYRKGICYL